MSILPSVLPNYTQDTVLDPLGARQDRLDITIGEWIIPWTAEAAHEFCQSLPGLHATPDGHIDLLGSPKGQFPHLKFPVRSSRSRRGGALLLDQPTFSGNLRLFPRSLAGVPASAPLQYRLTARLSLNPTIWVAHLGTGHVRTLPEEWPIDAASVFARQSPLYAWERPLVPAANVIVGTPRHLSLMRPDRWLQTVRRYVENVRHAFDMVLQSTASHIGLGEIQAVSFFAAHEIETHWEFWSTEPLREMQRLEQQLRSVVAVSSIGWVSIQHGAGNSLPAIDGFYAGTEHNSPCLRVQWGKGAFLRVYAKTTSRLRFEFVHKVEESRTTFPHRTGQDVDAVIGWLTAAAGNAASKTNTLLIRMRELAQEVPATPPKRAHDLISDIFVALAGFRASDNGLPVSADQAREIVEQLVVNGRIALSENNPQRSAVERLRNRQILQRSGHEGTTHVFVVVPRYRSALMQLRSLSEPLLNS